MSDQVEKLSFEESLERLEAVVRDLESTETGLDKSLDRYEDGVRLLKHCRKILQEAEQKIRLLTGVDAEGNPIMGAFDPASSSDRDNASDREPAAKSKRNTERTPRRAATRPPDGPEGLF